MSRPRIIGRLGDVGFPKYDGALVLRTPYGIEVEYLNLLDETDENGDPIGGYVGRFDVPAPGKWKDEWWAKDIESIANTCGQPVEELKRDLNSRNPMTRAGVLYYCVQGHWSLDDSAQRLTEDEIKKRYARSGPRRKRS